MSETFPRYYVSPYSGRVIKSTGKTYQFYKDNGYIMEKHKCFYNVKSAKKCLEKIITLYPALKFPSTFMNIPKTYESGLARGFVQDANEHVTAFVDKKGALNKLQKPIQIVQRHIIKVEDPLRALPAVLEGKQPVDTDTQKSIETQLKETLPLTPDIALVYNPVQNDFIPKTQEMTKEEMLSAIDTINRDLVPEGLPPISKPTGELAGIVQDPTTSDVVGVVDTQNQIKLFAESLTQTASTQDVDVGTQTESQTESAQTERQTASTQDVDVGTQTERQTESQTASTQDVDVGTQTESQTESQTASTDVDVGTQTESAQTESTDVDVGTPTQTESKTKNQTESTQTESQTESTKTESQTENQTESTQTESQTESTQTESQTESTQDVDVGTLPASIVTSIPSLVIDTDKIDSAVVMTPQETAKVIKDLSCLSGEQFDVSEQRCLPCTHYNLIWDPIYKKCKAMVKSDIKGIVLNDRGGVLGYTS